MSADRWGWVARYSRGGSEDVVERKGKLNLSYMNPVRARCSLGAWCQGNEVAKLSFKLHGFVDG